MSGNDTDGNHGSDEDPDCPDVQLKKDKKLLGSGALGTLYKTSSTKDQHAKSTKFKQFNFEKRTNTKLSCPLSHFDGFNLWLLKPTHMNRGRGIHVFNDLPTLQKLIKEYCYGKEEESIKKKYKQDQKEESPTKEGMPIEIQEEQPEEVEDVEFTSPGKKSPTKSKAYKIKHNNFVIQKYIEKPLLVCNRKFDFRVWVLLDQDQNLWMFKEGYIRLSGSDFCVDLENVDNA